MKEFLSNYNIEITATIVSALVSLIITIVSKVFTHLLGNQKLIFKEKAKIIGDLSKKKYEAIEKINEAIEALAQYEDLSITESKEGWIEEFLDNSYYTPAICYSLKDIADFASKLNEIHKDFGNCLTHRLAIKILLIRNFLMKYRAFCIENDLSDEEIRWLSVALHSEILKWYKHIKKDLIKNLNKPSTKYYYHSGFIYSIKLNCYSRKIKKSKMHKLIFKENEMFDVYLKNFRYCDIDNECAEAEHIENS